MSLFHRKKKDDAVNALESVEWSEAEKALARTRLESAQAEAEWPKVEKVTAGLARQLEQNNFSERIRLAYTPRSER